MMVMFSLLRSVLFLLYSLKVTFEQTTEVRTSGSINLTEVNYVKNLGIINGNQCFPPEFMSSLNWKNTGTRYVYLEFKCLNTLQVDPNAPLMETYREVTDHDVFLPLDLVNPVNSLVGHNIKCAADELLLMFNANVQEIEGVDKLKFTFWCGKANIRSCSADLTPASSPPILDSYSFISLANINGMIEGAAIQEFEYRIYPGETDPGNTYINIFYRTCSLCHYGCGEGCESLAPSETCTTCKSGYFPASDNPGKCYDTSCSTGYYYVEAEEICQKCDVSCKECTGSTTNCSECAEGYTPKAKTTGEPLPGECFNPCPDKWWSDGELCQPCHISCGTCKDSTRICLTCDTGSGYIPLDETTMCDLPCPTGYSLYKELDQPDKCVKPCPDGLFSTLVEGVYTCQQCDPNCRTCVNQPTHCLACSDLLYYMPSNLSCVEDCHLTNGFFLPFDSSDRTCRPCSSTCLTCKGDSETCSSCKNNMFFHYPDKSCYTDCPTGFYGNPTSQTCMKTAELVTDDFLDQLLETNEAISNGVITGLAAAMKSDDPSLTPAKLDKIYEITLKQINLILSGSIPAKADIITLVDGNLYVQVKKMINSENPTEEQKSEFKEKVSDLKEYSTQVIEKVLERNYDGKEPVTIGNDMITVQFGNLEDDSEMRSTAREKSLSVVDYSQCEEVLKRQYGIPEEKSLIVRKFDYSALLDYEKIASTYASGSVIFSYYDPDTREKLDIKYCNKTQIQINMPLRAPNLLNLDLANLLISTLSVDIFNPNDRAFNSRCRPIVDNKTESDTTVNYRIGNYYNGTATCSDNCTYAGLDEFNYMKCNCLGVQDGKELFHNIVKDTIKTVTSINLDIVICAEAITYNSAYQNPAVYISAVSFGLAVIGLLATYHSNLNVIYNPSTFRRLIENDAKLFDKDKMSAEDYFLNNKIVFKESTESNANAENVEYNNLKENEVEVEERPETNSNLMNRDRYKPEEVGQGVESINNNVELIELKKIDPDEESINSEVRDYRRVSYPVYPVYPAYPVYIHQQVETLDIPGKFDSEKTPIIQAKLITINDYSELKLLETLDYDNRTFLQLFWTYITETNFVLWLIFRTSILNPTWMRLLYLIFNISMIFAMNAIFFSDEYIDNRFSISKEERDDFWFTLVNEYAKSFLSAVATKIIFIISDFIIRIPKDYEEEFNKALITQDQQTVLSAYHKFKKRMTKRYIFYTVYLFLCNLFFWYYIIVFCSVYVASSTGWINGVILGLVMDLVVMATAVPLIRICNFKLAKRYKDGKLKYLIYLEYVFSFL